jgi:4-diphosphocytidyl-2-C-methyl-D-erythritol kinase
VVRAARLFQKTARIDSGLRIALEKKIPHGAGLGGGSSDAASTLLGLNELLGARLEQKDLSALASEIGSDVPFFIAGSAAICRGHGELVYPTTLSRSFSLLLLKPDFGVPTPWAYGRWKYSRELPGVNYAPQQFAGTRFVNDLERPVFEKFVLLGHIKTWLSRQPEVGAVLMSGSGSTMFAALREETDAEKLAARARDNLDPTLWTRVCQTG